MSAKWMSKPFNRKPLWAFHAEIAKHEMQPVFGFWSLLAIGVGGAVGSGIFVLSGDIAKTLAGPATAISFLIAGVICAITAVAYAELAARILSPGSTYSFVSHGIGEALSVVAGFLVSLEYGVSGAAVSRSWGDKLAFWLTTNGWISCEPNACWVNAVGGSPFNPAALLLSAGMVGLVLAGANVEKTAVNILVALKVGLVLFVIICGAVFVDPSNYSPFVPPPSTSHDGSEDPDFVGGFSGVLMGATSAFFAYIGFDEVTCMVGEAKNPKRNIPIAVLSTIFIITCMYFAAAIVLTGMAPYDQLDPTEGFGSAFVYVGAPWAMQVTLVGEVFLALPSVVLVSYIPQSRIFYAMSKDGQLPRIFSKQNAKGTLFYGGLISGIVLTLIAGFVPFANLNDLISGGILLSFIMTNTSLLLIRTEHKAAKPVFAYVVVAALAAFLMNKADFLNNSVAMGFTILFAVLAVGLIVFMMIKHDFSVEIDTFTVPLVPVIPCIAIFANWYLITMLSWLGIGLVIALVGLAFVVYAFYGYNHAVDYRYVQNEDQLNREVYFVDRVSSGSSSGSESSATDDDKSPAAAKMQVQSMNPQYDNVNVV